MANRRRVFRVAERIREVVAQEILRLADPRFHMVTITNVIVSPDLGYAKIYWVVPDYEALDSVNEAFKHAHGPLRKQISKELGIRFAPDIKFFYDDTLDTQEEVERLLGKIAEAK